MVVVIPQTLIDKLKSLGPHFIKVYSQQKKHPDLNEHWQKRPVGFKWETKENLMDAKNSELQQWL